MDISAGYAQPEAGPAVVDRSGGWLRQADVLGEVVAAGDVGRPAPADAVGGVGARVDVLEEVDDLEPDFLGLALTVTAGHGVVQPAVRHARVQLDFVVLRQS